MARVAKELMRQWKNKDTMTADDYNRERDMIVEAVNATDDELHNNYYSKAEVDDKITQSELSDHKGTWQGLTPQDISMGFGIQPENIGAARQDVVDALAADVNSLIAERYSLADFPRLEGETDDTGRFQRAVDAVPAGGTLIIPDGYYYVSSPINCFKPIHVVFLGDATVESTVRNAYTLYFGRVDTFNTYQLQSNVSRGTKDIVLTTTPTDFTVGDWIRIADNAKVGNNLHMRAEIHRVRAITNTNPNLVNAAHAPMNTDSNSDGIVDGFTGSGTIGNLTVARSLDTTEQAQKISVTNSTGTGYTYIRYDLSVTAGQMYTLSIQGKVGSVVNNFYGQVQVDFVDSGGSNVLGSFIKTFNNTSWATQQIANMVAPTGAVTAKVYLMAMVDAVGSTGDVWFKNFYFQLASTTVTLEDAIRFRKDAVTGSDYNVIKVDFIEGVSLRNARFKSPGHGQTNDWGSFVRFENARNVVVDGLYCDGSIDAGIELAQVVNADIRNVVYKDPQIVGSYATSGYGIYARTVRGVRLTNCVAINANGCYTFSNAFDCAFEDCRAYYSKYIAFRFANVGFVSDLHIRNNVADYTTTSNCVSFDNPNIPVTETTNYPFYNIVIESSHFRKLNSDYNGLTFVGNPRQCAIRNCTISYIGSTPPKNVTAWGIWLYPDADIVIEGCTIKGFQDAIGISVASGAGDYTPSTPARIIVRDCLFDSCYICFDIYTLGQQKRIIIQNLRANNIASGDAQNPGTPKIFDMPTSGGSIAEFVIDGLTITNPSSALTFIDAVPNPPTGDYVRGVIRGIRSDQPITINPAANFTISHNQIFLNSVDNTITLEGASGTIASATSGDVIAKGLVHGQKLIIVTTVTGTNKYTLNKGGNIEFTGGVTSVTLGASTSTDRRAILLTWDAKQQKWYQID